MDYGSYARAAARAAHELNYEGRHRTVDGQNMYVLPLEKMEEIKSDLVKITNLLCDLDDQQKKLRDNRDED